MSNRISLISNSSIQYHKFEADINLNFNNKLFFHEPFVPELADALYEPLFKVVSNGFERYYIKKELIKNDFLINDRLKPGVELSLCEEILTFYENSNLRTILKSFKNKWIPLPYFKFNSINHDIHYPTDWVRVYFNCDSEFKKVQIVFAIDTTSPKDDIDNSGPQLSLNPDENIYKLNSNDVVISEFLSNINNKWISEYIFKIYFENQPDLFSERPYKQYISNYILLLKWLESINQTPEFQLYTSEAKKIPVDLVIDIGNSSTCALLFENHENEEFSFKKVKKLIVQDYSNPEIEYDKPFPMNLIFSELNFGNIDNKFYHNNKFTIPSFVRIGFEAERLINNSSINDNFGRELKTHNSSPKRYLWDTKQSDQEWEFQPNGNNIIKKVYLSGISEQLNIDGTLKNANEPGASMSLFSRSSLLKFVFLELLIHSYVQINSFKFRKEHGNLTIPRTLKRITISCPTGMIQFEQIALREAAEDACKLLNNYVKYYFNKNDNKFWFDLPEIIPSVKDISKRLTDAEEKEDWIYDEATSCQLVFIYSLLSKKLKGNNYVIENYLFKNKDKLTIGSIDIGAGTTDVMIANYSLNKEQNTINIKPDPQYWDSFKLAGDDLLKAIIQNIIIKEIENFGSTKNVQNVSNKLNGFFGKDSNNIIQDVKIMRKAFIQQIAIPIAINFMKNANSDEIKNYKFHDILGYEYSNNKLLTYFENYFGFKFSDIIWNIDSEKINQITKSVFDRLINKLCLVLNQFQCDYIVLSGKPCSLTSMEELVLQYSTVASNNLINLNTYWIGKWFPFSDNSGVVEDSKTMVSIGAIVALMADKLHKIDDFKIDSKAIKTKLVSTANYIVNNNGNNFEILLSPDKNENSVLIETFPFQLGFTKYKSTNYQYSNLCCINIDNFEIIKLIKNRFPNKDSIFYEEKLNIEINKIRENLPLKVTLSRNYLESKEELKIEEIVDSTGEEKPKKFFKLNYQTLENVNGYWLDTCEILY